MSWANHFGVRRRARRLLLTDTVSSRTLLPPRALRPVIGGGLGLTAGLALTSVVAGLIVAGYALLLIRLRQRQLAARRSAQRRNDALELLAAYAADLRTGAVRSALLLPDPDLDRMAHAAQRLADRTGAPLAELLDRLEEQCRSVDRADAMAGAHAAGSRMTALLLAGLPVGGIGLGYLIGVDPLAMLLHTPLGVGCAGAAALLQAAGLTWAERLSRVGAAVPSARTSRRPRRRLRRLKLGNRFAGSAGVVAARLAGAAAGVVVVTLLPNVTGVALAVLAALVVTVGLRRVEPAWVRAERLSALTELPLAADLLGAALRSGAPVDAAVLGVADALDGPISHRLDRVGRSLRLGATPAEAWQHLADLGPARRLITAAQRSAASGAALAGALHRCADDLRTDAAVARQAGAQRAGVLIVLPLGLCFLPAFVLAGLVPVVLAVLGEVL